ncbi:MAG TPA: glycosyltransferase [Desulfobacteria bacterium]|nr:glycosyltransferase [Desulfobacteria bacterium]
MTEFEGYQAQVKANIQKLIETEQLMEAKEMIRQYEEIVQQDLEMYSMKAVISIMEGDPGSAERVLHEGLTLDNDNFDLLYNLGYLYENTKRFSEAVAAYTRAKCNCKDSSLAQEIEKTIAKIKAEHPAAMADRKKKLVFFVKQGMDSFLAEIIQGLKADYETRKVIVTNYRQIDEGMHWADICWFEWCDELIGYGSKHKLATGKKLICRLHSYEAFSNYPNNVQWSNVNALIFVAAHIRDFLQSQIKLQGTKTFVIPNGLRADKYTFVPRHKGYNVAYMGYVNYKKGPMLLIQVIKALVDRNPKYKLFIAGKFQEARYVLYFQQMIAELGLSDNVIFDGWQTDINQWLNDKDYIISTSLLESQHLSIMEAMCKGIKPVVHNFVGARQVYKSMYVWNTIDEAVQMIESEEYNSFDYREFVEANYSYERQIDGISRALDQLLGVS